MIDFAQQVEAVLRQTHLPMIQTEFGTEGVSAAFRIMQAARSFFSNVEVERVTGSIVIFETIGSARMPSPGQMPIDFASYANKPVNGLVIEILSDQQAYEVPGSPPTPSALASNSVVYEYSQGVDTFYARTQAKTVIRLDNAARSQFAIPTLSTLREALNRYGHENIRESTCFQFQDVWHDPKRLFLKAKPEKTMRRSLTMFLRARLGSDHDVDNEHVVDESHPVDILVRRKFSDNKLMLIEIKWLGVSVDAAGNVTTRYSDSRAQDGARQLAEYLDSQRASAPSNVSQGFYVIIDARRKNLKEGAASIDTVNGLHFENVGVSLVPDYPSLREDFDPPYVMFARPICD